MGFLSFIWFFHLSLVQAEGSACFLLFCFPLVRTWLQEVVFYNHNFLLFFCHFPLWPQCVLAIFHHNQCQHLSCITLLFFTLWRGPCSRAPPATEWCGCLRGPHPGDWHGETPSGGWLRGRIWFRVSSAPLPTTTFPPCVRRLGPGTIKGQLSYMEPRFHCSGREEEC